MKLLTSKQLFFLSVFCLSLTWGLLVSAHAQDYVLVFKETAGMKPNLYAMSGEEAKSKGLDAWSHIVLSADEVGKLKAGEVVIVSDRMPKRKLVDGEELDTAWGVGFTKSSANALYKLTLDHANYTNNFPSILECDPYPLDGEDKIVHMKKKASVNVDFTLAYDYVDGVSKEWNLASESDLKGYPEEEQAKIKDVMKKNDFIYNSGGWYFVPAENEVMGEYKSIAVYTLAVKLSGIKNWFKSPAKAAKEAEESLPVSIKNLVKNSTKYAE